MIVIDGKAHRNMPEQVAKNQKDIEDIFNTLDGLNIQDNVVAIADLSHMLTQDELEIVERAVAFIVYNDHLFIKRDQDGTNAYFDIVFSISGSTVISFNSDKMQVNLTTGALTLVSNTFTTYSKTELDTLIGAKASTTYVDTQLALKANLSGANFTGAITAPSIIENMSGYSMTLLDTSANGYTVTATYGGIVKNGNKLTIVFSGNITITDENYTPYLYLNNIKIPSDVGSKLYPTTISAIDALDLRKCLLYDSAGSFQTPIEKPAYTEKASNTSLYMKVYASGLTNGKTYFIRYELTFLLSENLIP